MILCGGTRVEDKHIFGGGTRVEDKHIFGDCLSYVFQDNEWKPFGAPMLEPRWGHGCVELGGRIYVCGGSDGYAALDTVESCNATGDGDWRAEPRMTRQVICMYV
jgi:hypothetical protein